MPSTTASTSLAAKSTTQNGDTVDFATAKRLVSAVIVPSGLVSGGMVGIEASHDGLNWVPHGFVVVDRAANLSYDVSTGAYRYWRAVITGPIKGGGTVTVTFMEAG